VALSSACINHRLVVTEGELTVKSEHRCDWRYDGVSDRLQRHSEPDGSKSPVGEIIIDQTESRPDHVSPLIRELGPCSNHY
jgi:hypothetical protein